jgi:hypothetical protein
LFCLSGAVQITASDGEVSTVIAGDASMMTDVSGKGQTTEVVSSEPFDVVVVILDNIHAPAKAN